MEWGIPNAVASQPLGMTGRMTSGRGSAESLGKTDKQRRRGLFGGL